MRSLHSSKSSQFSGLSGQFVRKHVLTPLTILAALLLWAVGEGISHDQSLMKGAESSWLRVLGTFYRSVYVRLKENPQICQKAHEKTVQLNSFQAKQCYDFMSDLYRDATVASIPFIIPLFLYIAFALWASWVYATAHRRVQSKTPKAIGVLTEPMELPMDSFGWWACLRPVMVQLKDRRQIKVYLSYSDQISAPGRRVAVFKLFTRGKRRYVAVPYLPELFVRSMH